MRSTRPSNTQNLRLTSSLWAWITTAVVLSGTITQPVGATAIVSSSEWSNDITSPDECSQQPTLSPEYWNKMDLDQYLRNYPNGNSLSFPEYVEHIPTGFPFECGIGKQCHVPPICKPLRGADWYILFATSQWNYYVNTLSAALWQSFEVCKDIIPEVLDDFVRNYTTSHARATINEVDLVRALLAPINPQGTETNSTAAPHIADWNAAVAPIIADGPQTLAYVSPARTATKPSTHTSSKNTGDGITVQIPGDSAASQGNHKKVKRQLLPHLNSNIPMIVYNSSQPVVENLVQTNTQLQNILADSIAHKLQSPISLDEGIYSSLKGGRFLVDNIGPARLLHNAKKIVVLLSLSALLSDKNAMIIVRKSSCHKHRNLQRHSRNKLNFCASDGTFIEIVEVSNNRITNEVYNGHLIQEKYGFTTSFLASKALECHQANIGVIEDHKPNQDEFDVCTFELPICNLTEPKFQKLLNDGASILKLCREEAGVLI